MSDISKRRFRIALAIVLLLLGGALAVRTSVLVQERAEARRQLEESLLERAKLEGVLVAEAIGKAELLLSLSDSMLKRIELVEEITPGTTVREVVRWRTRTARLPCEETVPPGVSKPAAGVTPPPPAAPATPTTPPPAEPSYSIDLYVVGREARLVTESGNWLAVGEVDLVREEDDLVMATLPWQVDASDLLVADLSLVPKPKDYRWVVGLGPGVIDGQLGLGALLVGPAWQPRLLGRSLGRWRPWATGVVAGLESYVPQLESNVRSTQACAAAGIGLEW